MRTEHSIGSTVDPTFGGMSELVDAVYSEKFDKTIELLRAGADPNEVDEIDRSALMVACGMAHTRFIAALLFHGAEMTYGVRSSLAMHRDPGGDGEIPDVLVAFAKGAHRSETLKTLHDEAFLDALDAAVDDGAYPCAGGVVRELVRLLTGTDAVLSERASMTLTKILEHGWSVEPIVQALAERLDDADAAVRTHAIQWLMRAARGGAALEAIGPELVRALDRTTEELDFTKSVIIVLGFSAARGFDLTPARKRIEDLLAHDDAVVRNFTVRMLMRFRAGDGDLAPFRAALGPLQDDADEETRDLVRTMPS